MLTITVGEVNLNSTKSYIFFNRVPSEATDFFRVIRGDVRPMQTASERNALRALSLFERGKEGRGFPPRE